MKDDGQYKCKIHYDQEVLEVNKTLKFIQRKILKRLNFLSKTENPGNKIQNVEKSLNAFFGKKLRDSWF